MSKVAETTASRGSEGFGLEAWKQGFAERTAKVGVTGFDADREKAAHLEAGESYIRMIPSGVVRELVDGGRFHATVDFAETAHRAGASGTAEAAAIR